MEKILIIEDDKNLSEILKYLLVKENFTVITAFDGESGYSLSCTGQFDVIVLDLMLPKLNGFQVLEKLKKDNISSKVIMLTAIGDEASKVRGLLSGAFDYITKPFSNNEFVARVKVALRESSLNKKKYISLNDENKSIVINSKEIDLTINEYNLLKLLIDNPNKIFTREEILKNAWGYKDFLGETRLVDVTVTRLRSKIEKNPKEAKILKTRRSLGYFIDLNPS